MSANIGRARLVGAVADAIAESDVLAETANVSGLATQGGGEPEHVLDASLLKAEGQRAAQVQDGTEELTPQGGKLPRALRSWARPATAKKAAVMRTVFILTVVVTVD